ncbi:DNA-binding MarR family transcriptional regulator [Pacificibacter maritimus]|uniref:DNA-binding MarR family transcriptional regulator n=1 Tax=Pacificibacter maritimus TaxID=762213 RepID=A0A3N4V3E2_9RHOB|nr:MarR family winged helix-turn-helix transcriptional regulator [Pacificibacter maritimus]RPE67464.1 DNA-binding MarR family transcriptional regulator [Pacificibacter maritimus]
MTTKIKSNANQIRSRKEREGLNIFSRLPAVYAASRTQSRNFLELAGGLSVVEWRTLWDLAEAGPLTIRDLAAIQRADHSLLSRALPEMRKKGYVTMQRDARDGRQTIVELTEQGRAAYDTAAPVMAKRRAALKEVFSDTEIREFAGFLDRLEDFLRVPAEDLLAGQMAQEDTQ